MIRICFVAQVIILFLFKSSSAQFESQDIGARAIGLNGAFTSLSNNSLAVFYNPSGLGQLEYTEVSVFYSPSPFGINQISSAAFSFAKPAAFGCIGLGLKTYGFDLYRESNLILSYGNSFSGKFFYGLNLNVYNLSIQNYGSAISYSADAGALTYLTNFLRWGFFAGNVNGAKIGSSKAKLPQIYRTGFTAQLSEEFNLIFEAEKDVRFPLSFRSGFEYFIGEYFELRSGISTEPVSFAAGVSIDYDIFQIEYAIHNYQDLGITNQASLTINFGGTASRKLMREQLKKSF